MNTEARPGMPYTGLDDAGLDDARLERLLREDAARDPYIEDGGFTARVMAGLPAPRRQRSSRAWSCCRTSRRAISTR